MVVVEDRVRLQDTGAKLFCNGATDSPPGHSPPPHSGSFGTQFTPTFG